MEIYHGYLEKNETLEVPRDTTVQQNAYNELSGFCGVRRQVQDDETTTQHLVTCNIITSTKLQ